MNSQDFLTLNLVGAGAFIFWYLISRGGSHEPTKLDPNAKDSGPTWTGPENKIEEPKKSVATTQTQQRHPDVQARAAAAKNLNVMFNYNGHSWDAYEVLGVPAGASMKIVTDAYQTALRNSDKESIEFLETAYKAILHKK
jgi:hypothetical protein